MFDKVKCVPVFGPRQWQKWGSQAIAGDVPVDRPVDNVTGLPGRIARQPAIRARNQVRCRLAYCRVWMIAASRAAASVIPPRRCAIRSAAPMAFDDRRPRPASPAASPAPPPARPAPASGQTARQCGRSASRRRERQDQGRRFARAASAAAGVASCQSCQRRARWRMQTPPTRAGRATGFCPSIRDAVAGVKFGQKGLMPLGHRGGRPLRPAHLAATSGTSARPSGQAH